MASAPIDIALRAKDNASAPIRAALQKIEGQASTTSDYLKRVGGLLATAFSAYAIGNLANSFVTAANTAQGYRTRLEILTGSQEEANRVFEKAAEYAGRVPYEYEQIMGAATQLAAVTDGTAEGVMRWLPLIGDLAAASGLTIEETTGQVVRMMSAGAGAADLFRERGVLAMLGFQAGATYSAQQTREKLVAEWEKTGSAFRGATDKMAATWEGATSMMADAWFKVKQNAGDFLVQSPAAVAAVKAIADEVTAWADEIQKLGVAQPEIVGNLIEGLVLVAKAGLFVVQVFNGITLTVQALEKGIVEFTRGLLVVQAWALYLTNIGGINNELLGGTQAAITSMETLSSVISQGMDQDVKDIMAAEARIKALGEAAERVKAKVGAAVKLAEKPKASGAGRAPREAAPNSDAMDQAKRWAIIEAQGLTDIWEIQAAEKKDVLARGLAAEREAAEEAKRIEEERLDDSARKWNFILEMKRGKAKAEAEEQAQEDARQRARFEFKARMAADNYQRQLDAVEDLGSLGANYYARETARIADKAALMRKAGEDEIAVRAWVAAESKRIREEELQEQFAAADSLYGALSAGAQLWALEHMTTVQTITTSIFDMLDQAISGTAQLVAQGIVYGKNMATLGSALLKQLAATAIASVIQMTAQYIISSLMSIQAAATETASKVAGAAAVTYANAFASTVYFLTPVGAAGYAAGAVAAMNAGATASYAATFAQFQGLAGVAHSGLDSIPREGTYLLDRGERVVARDTNRDLKDFLTSTNNAGPVEIVLVLGERELGRAIADLHNSGRVPLKVRAA